MMRKYTLLFIAISVVMLSCKKSKPLIPAKQDSKLYRVTFNVSGFTQTQEPIVNLTGERLTATDTHLKALMNYMAYRIYTPDGVLVRSRFTRGTDTNFGIVTDSLAAGDYTIAFLGYLNTKPYTIGGIPPDDMFFLVGSGGPLQEVLYYQKTTFNVPYASVHKVTLARVSAALQLVVKDALPANVKSIIITYQDYNGFLMFKNQPVWNWDFEHPENNDEDATIDHTFTTVVNAPAGTTNLTTIAWPCILNTVTPMDITITAYSTTNSTGSVIAKKTVHNVTFKRNTKTILTGNLFITEPVSTNFKSSFKYNTGD